MSFGNTTETDLLKLIFQNVDMALVGDATGLRGSSVAGSLYVSLHTADPGEAGDSVDERDELRRLRARGRRTLGTGLDANVPDWATKTPLEIANVIMGDDERWWVNGKLVVDCEPMAALLALVAGAQAGAPPDPVAAAGVSAYGVVGGKLRQALA